MFNVLTDIFDRVGLHTNVGTPGGILESAYTQHGAGVGPSYRERLRWRIQCLECGVELATGSLMEHCQGKHGVGLGYQGRLQPPSPTGEAHTYQVSFLAALTCLRCPVEGVNTRTNLRVHFAQCHVRDRIMILDEGNRN